jgi:glutamate/tyrosine decarboxylase-like PLP-dependent enzyme
MDAKEFRDVGHRVVDLLGDYLDHIAEKRVFPDVEPRTANALFAEPLPQDPSPAETVLNELETKLFPYCTNVGHPGYMGLITPSPSPVGIIADFICSALNQNVGAYSIGPSALAMERRVVRWLTDLCGYGANAGGNLTSGGMMANFIGLKVGRDAVTGDRAQHDGVRERCSVYASEERHVSVDKAVDCIGFGRNALRPLPTDANLQVRIDALEEAIAQDKQNGVRPICIVGVFGTTNTGAVDAPATCAGLPTAKVCGCMWMRPTAAACCSRTSGRCEIEGLSLPIPSPSTRISGFMLRSMPELCW